jgi:hypothetical protein
VADRLDAVLPLTAAEAARAQILFRSLETFFQPLGTCYVVAPDHDAPAVASRAAALVDVFVADARNGAFRAAPELDSASHALFSLSATDADAHELVQGGTAGERTRCFRGRPAADSSALTDPLHRVVRLAEDLPESVDAGIRVAPTPRPDRPKSW